MAHRPDSRLPIIFSASKKNYQGWEEDHENNQKPFTFRFTRCYNNISMSARAQAALAKAIHDKLRYLSYRTRKPMTELVLELLSEPLAEAMRRDAESQKQEYLQTTSS